MISIMFYLVSFLMLGFANMMILSNYPVRAVLSLIGCFLCASILWILLDAEFLALMLIFVYHLGIEFLDLFDVDLLEPYDHAFLLIQHKLQQHYGVEGHQQEKQP